MSDKNLPRCWVQEITKTQGSHILHSTGNIVLMKKDANMAPVYQPASLPSCQLGLLYCLSATSSISWLSESGLARQWQGWQGEIWTFGKDAFTEGFVELARWHGSDISRGLCGWWTCSADPGKTSEFPEQTNKLIPLLQNTYPVYLVLEGAFIATIKVGLHESLG